MNFKNQIRFVHVVLRFRQAHKASFYKSVLLMISNHTYDELQPTYTKGNIKDLNNKK